MKESIELLKTLTDVNGIASYEYQVKEKMRDYLTPISDEIIEDGLGGIFGKKESKTGSKSLMLAGHLDEIGFIVTKIDNNGFIKFQPIGGWWSQVMLSQKVTITTDDGKEIRGIIGSKPPHVLEPEARKKSIDIKDMFIDIGVRSKADAEQYGIEIGNMITPYSEFEQLANGKYLTAKAFDNRYGCALAIDVLNNLKDESIGINLYAGGTVQEEVGLRGAHVSTTKFDPEVFFAVDCSPAGDIYGNQGKVGDGTLIRFFDPGHIMLPNMKDFLLTTAEEAGIKYQYYCAAGGTDAGAAHLQNAGVPSTTIGVCARYIHSHQTLYAMDDFLEAQAFLQAIVKKLDRSTVDLIKNY